MIEKFSHDGRGLVRVDGKATFIEGALPGETVNYEVLRKKRDFDEGRAIDILIASDDRVEPRCMHFAKCGGCSLQHLNEHAQIHVKEAQLLDLLTRIGHVTPETILKPLVSDAWHYRNKARLSVSYSKKNQKVFIGFRHKNNPRLVTDVKLCSILNKSISIESLQSLILSLENPSDIPQIEVAVGDDGAALIIRHLSALSLADEDCLRSFAEQTKIKLFVQSGGQDTVRLLSPENADDYLSYCLPDQDITFKFHPTDFTQVNAGLNKKMVTLALDLLDLEPTDVVLDLFCGLGNFSLPIAKQASAVIGVEGTLAMVKRAEMNALANGLSNTTFLAHNLEEQSVVAELKKYEANKLLIDPPRVGAYNFVKCIDSLNLKRLVYVSCNPATLARDIGHLVHEKGFQLSAVGVMDMFPHTTHVESIALLEKK